MFDFLVLGFALCFSVLLPFAILSLRRTVRLQRRSIILDLRNMLCSKGRLGACDYAPASHEAVRTKYFDPLVEFEAVKSGIIHEFYSPDFDDEKKKEAKQHFALGSNSYLAFILCSIPLVVLVFALSVFAISVIIFSVLPRESAGFLPAFTYFLSPPLDFGDKAILWVFVVAFLGGYLFAVRGLLRAVNNFDLSPGSFLSAALQLLFGVVTAVLIVVGGVNKAMTGTFGVQAAASASVLAAFVIGFVPELGIRTLYRAARLRHFKHEDPGVYSSFQATPVEVVDGIDTEIRNRLADFNIFSVQNLATANPIMLFVETPFHIYQSIDWVAQAQLFAAVGPSTVLKLWKLGIRTIFDLERAVLAPGHTTPQLRQVVGQALLADPNSRALLADPDEGGRKRFGPPVAPLDDASVEALVRNMLDDLHVHRLRQIIERIEDHLGAGDERRAPAASAARPTPAPKGPPSTPGPDAANDAHGDVARAAPAPNGEAGHGPRPGNGRV